MMNHGSIVHFKSKTPIKNVQFGEVTMASTNVWGRGRIQQEDYHNKGKQQQVDNCLKNQSLISVSN